MRPRVIKAGALTEPPRAWAPTEPRAREVQTVTQAGPVVDSAAVEAEAREHGLAEGMRAAEEAYQAKMARLGALGASLQEERASFFDRVEPELVRLAVTIGEKIIAQELELRPEMVVDLVRNAMRRVRDREALRVSVNPHDLEQVRAAREDLISAVDGIKKLEVIEDRRVDRGGCIIESQNGTLDARISTQMEEINRALEGVMPNGESNDAEAGSQPLAGLEPVPAGDRPD